MPIREKQIQNEIYEMQSQIYKAMGHPIRLEIIDLLEANEMCASELSKANLSKQMTLLIQVGVMAQKRVGRRVFYRPLHPEIHDACQLMRTVLRKRLKRDERLAKAIRT